MLLRILERRGWSEATWDALPLGEKETVWAYELTRQQMIEKTMEQALSGDKPYAEVVMVQLIAALLRIG
jgi:hypothetical protein